MTKFEQFKLDVLKELNLCLESTKTQLILERGKESHDAELIAILKRERTFAKKIQTAITSGRIIKTKDLLEQFTSSDKSRVGTPPLYIKGKLSSMVQHHYGVPEYENFLEIIKHSINALAQNLSLSVQVHFTCINTRMVISVGISGCQPELELIKKNLPELAWNNYYLSVEMKDPNEMCRFYDALQVEERNRIDFNNLFRLIWRNDFMKYVIRYAPKNHLSERPCC